MNEVFNRAVLESMQSSHEFPTKLYSAKSLWINRELLECSDAPCFCRLYRWCGNVPSQVSDCKRCEFSYYLNDFRDFLAAFYWVREICH